MLTPSSITPSGPFITPSSVPVNAPVSSRTTAPSSVPVNNPYRSKTTAPSSVPVNAPVSSQTIAPSSVPAPFIGPSPASLDANTTMASLGLITGLIIFMIIWGLLGFIAFIYSIFCFWKSGTTIQHIIGLLLAFFFGPFYFFYYKFVPGYCNSK